MVEILNDFVHYASVEQSVIDEYTDKVPDNILAIWKQLGLGYFMNGYLKIIDPNEYQQLVGNTYFRGKESIPIMLTGLGDVITWEKGKYLGLIKYRRGTFEILETGCSYFWEDLLDESYVLECLDNQQYFAACNKYGNLKYDECFGYTPLLGLGGSEIVDNLKKVRIKEHILIIAQLVGGIGI